MNHFKAMLHTPNHDIRQVRRISWSIVSKAADRSSKTGAVGSSRDGERWISLTLDDRRGLL